MEVPFTAHSVVREGIVQADRGEFIEEKMDARFKQTPAAADLPYIAVYRITEHAIEVLRVYHGAQDRP